MTAFDTDVLSEVFACDAAYVQRFDAIDADKRGLPIVVSAEIVRGWLAAVRQAEAGKGRWTLDEAFALWQQSLVNTAPLVLLPQTATAHALVRQWQRAKIRVGTNDLRIAAICVDHGATLATRNARDDAQVPGLTLDVDLNSPRGTPCVPHSCSPRSRSWSPARPPAQAPARPRRPNRPRAKPR
ncbi:MAG: type II toxin-antitoxin system VapC family toxin [Gemmataceae bacterium]|nr:type II toxin-antitoxin system VapC family toxin [Gemmataceae bacterium]